jgi:hypothetical protein
MRGHNDYPVTIASTFVNAEACAPYSTLQQGIPKILGPDLSSGRVPLDLAAGFYTPELGNIDRGYVHTWNIAVERMLPFDATVEVAYVGAKGVDGYAGLDINAPQTLGAGDAGRPYVAWTLSNRSSCGETVWIRATTRCRSRSTSACRTGFRSRARTRWPRR